MKTLALQIDEISSLNYETDTSLFIAQEFMRRNWRVFAYKPADMQYIDGKLTAAGFFIEINEEEPRVKKLSEVKDFPLELSDILLLRQNPPFNMDYITSTYLLDLLPERCKIFNSPSAVRDISEKISALRFTDDVPTTIISNSYQRLREFFMKHDKVVIKSLYGFGGNDVKLVSSEHGFEELVPEYIKTFNYCIMQEYLDVVTKRGDKRVLVVDGRVLGVLARYPADGSILANVAQGGSAAVGELTQKESKMLTPVLHMLKKHGIFIAGIDLLDSKILEINVTSPTGFKIYSSISGIDLSSTVVDMLLKQ